MFDNIIPLYTSVAFYEIKHPISNNNPTLMHKSPYLVLTPFRLFVTIIRRGDSNKTTFKYNIDGVQQLLEIKLKIASY